MKYLAHRGLWSRPEEKNSPAALLSALASGFGIETDFRDSECRLVVAHDPAPPDAYPAEDFFAAAAGCPTHEPLALNIKADGLRKLLRSLLARHPALDYFCFDMSVPETLTYRRDGLRFFTRESEYEPTPPLYADAAGVWMDMFHSEWIQPAHIARHVDAGKQVALVSPELHGRPHAAFWELLRGSGLATHPDLMLCTDFPAAAREFFHV